ncbi:MAG: N-acetyl-gamma-glutamyl-phosphate reductase [Candidatus Cyclobacteriaceae bacterium M3_2C_046]
MIKAGIVGGAGYTSGELLRILLYHPDVEISFVHSQSQSGKAVSDVHRDLLGETALNFTGQLDQAVDVIFLCLGHGQSQVFLQENPIASEIKIIDLSQDFRLARPNNDFVYGLPEIQKEKIAQANHVANPGCFATAIQLALLPLAQKKLIKQAVHINAITGSTGAGQAPTAYTHFSWRSNNISVYKTFNHQHLHEINQTVKWLDPEMNHPLLFIPMRGDFARGILATAYTNCDLSIDEANQLYRQFYQDHPFTLVTDQNPSLKQVINTNKCLLYLEKHQDQLLIVSLIDNLVKGASGQAVQNMNLMFGLPEQQGLRLKPVAF